MTNNQAIAFLESSNDSLITARRQVKRSTLNIQGFGVGSLGVSWFRGFGMRNLSIKWNGSTVLKLAVKA